MENIIYSLGYEKIKKKDIQRVLKFNGIEFINNDDTHGYIDFLSKLKKMISINMLGSSITIGYVYNESFKFEYKGRSGFNYDIHFTKMLFGMRDLYMRDLTTTCLIDNPSENNIISINLAKNKTNKTIEILNSHNINHETMVTSSFAKSMISSNFKHVNLDEYKKKGVEKLFICRFKNFYMVVGSIMKGNRNRQKFIPNSCFTSYLMNIKVFNLKMPSQGDNSLDMDIISFKKNDFSCDHEKDNLINPFKFIPKSKSKKPLAYTFHDRSGFWVDKTPGVIKINAILDKIIILGIVALSKDELDFLNNNS